MGEGESDKLAQKFEEYLSLAEKSMRENHLIESFNAIIAAEDLLKQRFRDKIINLQTFGMRKKLVVLKLKLNNQMASCIKNISKNEDDSKPSSSETLN
jgi:hypothetical protein